MYGDDGGVVLANAKVASANHTFPRRQLASQHLTSRYFKFSKINCKIKCNYKLDLICDSRVGIGRSILEYLELN